MPKAPDFYVVHSHLSGHVYLINGMRKGESVVKHLNRLNQILEKPDIARLYRLEDFFSKFEFDKSKIEIGWCHSTNDLMLWHKKIFSIRNRYPL
jgi:hypothetical protein